MYALVSALPGLTFMAVVVALWSEICSNAVNLPSKCAFELITKLLAIFPVKETQRYRRVEVPTLGLDGASLV